MPYTIPIVEKTFRVINAIATDGGALSMHQLAKNLEIAPSTCFRIIRTLSGEGWIAEKRTGGWELSAGLVRLLDGLAPVQKLIDAARDPLDQLVGRTHLAGKLSVRQGDNAVTVLRSDSPAGISMSGRLGATFPLALGSSGAALSSEMSDRELDDLITRTPESAWKNQTRDDFLKRAVAAREGKPILDRGSYSRHVHTASVPIHDPRGEVIGAITLLAMEGDFSEKVLPIVQRGLVACARDIEQAFNPVRTGKKP